MKTEKLLFGTAGVPLSADDRSSENGVKRVRELNLECMELEFVRGVRMSTEIAEKVGKAARDNKILLTAHGPYFINLNSNEVEIVEASIKRILDTARVASLCRGYSITFHAGYYLKMEKDTVYNNIKKELERIVKTLKSEGIKVWIRPETTGKETQFGSLAEIIKLSRDIENVLPCVDFAHIHARTAGRFNTQEEIKSILSDIEKGLGREALDNMHIHMAGIEYTAKGERNHVNLEESDLNYKEILKQLKEFKCKGALISESPNIEGDALLMKKEYERI
ncbi:TIM barrel protein [Candidatus Woesearchaeota archaeon]|nr:TIM barrel protein [Candidatus Woesearchaeota archaeon]